ncbi:hypothetical protein BDQ12DRAFT_49304 [Crucibulum laeve]|uniref:Uncharacterized protein n=1 Tax=Crucibulum laeve TaxID=68775 RepID=A0A5C3MKA3_9AGAR|nr:hypothetical protein BDQ12DRAFT_49304 [Crucibulum laeve]
MLFIRNEKEPLDSNWYGMRLERHFSAFGLGAFVQRIRYIPSWSRYETPHFYCTVILQKYLRRCIRHSEIQIKWLLALETSPSSLNTLIYGRLQRQVPCLQGRTSMKETVRRSSTVTTWSL